MHGVYKEIVAISQVLHENVVRYYACWIESVSPKDKAIKNVVRKLETDIKKKFKVFRRIQKQGNAEKETKDLLDLEKSLKSSKKKLNRRQSLGEDQIKM
jgi:hypothetical protein